DASGYQHAEQPPSASVPSEPKKPKFAALPKMPVQAKAPAQPAQGELPDPSSTPAQTSVSVDETYAAPLPDMSADSSQAHERHGVPAALKSALPQAPIPTEPATASEPSAETAGYQEVARQAPAALKAPLPKAPLPKALVPEVHQAAAPAPPTPHDPAQAAAPAPPTPHDTARAAPAPPTPHDTARAAPAPPTPHDTARAAPAPPTPHDTAWAAAPAPPTPHDTARAAAPAPPTPHDTTQEMFEAPAVDSHKTEQTATAPVPDPTPTTAVTAAAPAPPTAMPEAQKPAPSEKPKFAPLPSVPKLPPKPVAQPPKPAVPEASEESSEDELIPATPQGPPEEVAAPQPPLPKGWLMLVMLGLVESQGWLMLVMLGLVESQGQLMLVMLGLSSQRGKRRPGPRVNAGLPAAARRQRMELVSNLQWLCRLFLETREQLFAAHEGTETEANCEGLREELDAVLFRRLLEETLTLPETAASPKSLIRLLRSFGRRALYGRRRSVYGRRAHLHFQQACAAKGGPRAFVLGAVPKILQLMSRLVDEGHASMDDAVEDGGDDPWLGSGTAGDDRAATSPKAHGGLPDWETLEGILSEPKDLRSLQDEADAFLAEAAKPLPAPLRLTEADRAPLSAEAPNSGSFAPRGRRAAPGAGKASADGAANSRRIPAQKPFYSTEPSLLLKVAKAPLPNLDQLVACLVPGAEITTEGLLLQLADDDLVIVAYALQQIEEAASKRLIKELEVRDELRST
ncbi:ttn-1, partial [Symbiodinium microadriaticum]